MSWLGYIIAHELLEHVARMYIMIDKHFHTLALALGQFLAREPDERLELKDSLLELPRHGARGSTLNKSKRALDFVRQE